LSSPSGALGGLEVDIGSSSIEIRGVEGNKLAGLDTEEDIDEVFG
jgi:hypothetical protein